MIPTSTAHDYDQVACRLGTSFKAQKEDYLRQVKLCQWALDHQDDLALLLPPIEAYLGEEYMERFDASYFLEWLYPGYDYEESPYSIHFRCNIHGGELGYENLKRVLHEISAHSGWKRHSQAVNDADGTMLIAYNKIYLKAKLRVSYRITFSEDSGKCRLVKVGEDTKTITKPRYQVICEDSSKQHELPLAEEGGLLT